MTLLEFLRSLIYDDEARQEFADNPDQALADAGLDHLSAADVHDALSLMQDDSQEADFSRDTDTGGNEINIAPPAPVESHDGGDESAVEYINKYITNNYIDDRDTTIDNSVNQQIDTGGGGRRHRGLHDHHRRRQHGRRRQRDRRRQHRR